jgi:hypothetical protein
LPDLEWLPGWSGQTTDELLALEGRFRADSIVLAFEQALDAKASANPQSLAEPEWVILAAEALEREVNNGGFQQFFINCEYCSTWVADALDRVGRKDMADLARKAVAALSASLPESSEALSAQAAAGDPKIMAALEACDQAYYAHAGDLAPNLLAFIKQECSAIKLPKPPK